jgi:hypothetical protein
MTIVAISIRKLNGLGENEKEAWPVLGSSPIKREQPLNFTKAAFFCLCFGKGLGAVGDRSKKVSDAL